MNRLKKIAQHEEGQSLIIVGGLLIVLVALIGLVVDAGNAYAQRRIVQNAADAAALAGSQMLVHQEDYLNGGPFLRNWQVIAAAEDFADRNGVDPDDLAIFYTDIDGNILADARFDLGRQDIINKDTFGEVRAEGIRVEADLPFPTYLIRVIGRNEMTASGSANGILACGACTAGGGEGMFPIAVHVGLFDDSGSLPVLGRQYRIFEKEGEPTPGTGSFGWLSWNDNPGHTSAQTLIENMRDTTRSGTWSVGDWIPTSTGLESCSECRTELQFRIDDRTDMSPSRPATVTLPIYDVVEGTGQNLEYHIVGFGRFRLDCYHFSRTKAYGSCEFQFPDNSKWIAGTFVDWLDPTGEAGCTNYGICSAKLRPPLQTKRTLVGNVVPWQVRPSEDEICEGGDMPVDLIHVMDISGSMCAEWNGDSDQSPPCTGRTDGGTPNRIQAAKDVITDFNEGMDWNVDNQVGLATYPTVQHSTSYYTECGIALGTDCKPGSQADCYQTANTLYFGTKNLDLTTDLSYVNSVIDNLTANGGTPLPIGMQYGREMVSDPDHHDTGNMKVIILTTDGMPNVKLNGYWTGYSGNYVLPPLIVESGCNDIVYQDAIQQANLAKEDGVVIFTIGIHTNVDENLMRSIASPDTDPDDPHFFVADSDMEFDEIYEQIMERLPTLCSEECVANENATVGAGATVSLYDKRGNLVATTTADASGGYIFTDIEPGTYELRASWTDPIYRLVYDVLTWVLGGPPLGNNEEITVEIPLGTGSTHKDVYLRTDQQLDCD